MRRLHFVGGSLALAMAGSAPGATMDDPICTDRPGKGSATCAVPKGHWQVESSLADWTLTKDSGTRTTALVLGATALKYGLGPRTNIEVAWTPYIRSHSRGGGSHAGASGVGDVYLKLKQELGTTGALSAALYPFVKLPTAPRRLGNRKVEAGLVVPLSLALGTSPLSLSASPELDLAPDADGHGYHAGMKQQLSLNWQATDAFGLSAELWHGWDWDRKTTHQASADASAAYKLNPNLQFDGGVNLGLNRATADVEIYGGVSARF